MHQPLCMFAFFGLRLIFTVSAFAPPDPSSPSDTLTDLTSNATLPTFITAPLLNTTNTDGPPSPECLKEATPSSPMLRPINIVHCYQLLTHLLAGFSSSPVAWNTPDHPVPKIWTHGTCMITFEKLSAESWDVFSELQVAKAAAWTIVKCVKADTRWLGGRVAVGPRMGFMVAVFGRGYGRGTEMA